jgi:pimeloyl-ACP methyl ester carboxylesterase
MTLTLNCNNDNWYRLGIYSILLSFFTMASCSTSSDVSYVSKIYSETAQEIRENRTPVVVLPGILGSKIEDQETGMKVWGAFTFGAADVDKPDGARMFALPMKTDVPLSELRDRGEATEVLDYIVADVGIFQGLKLGAYVDIMKTLAAGKYRDESFGESGYINYGGLHYTCYQYPYDWRRDISEQASALNQKILRAQIKVRSARGLDEEDPIKIDVVAHSMGGLVLRYYLRYGAEPLPDDGSLPELTWAGAENVSRAFLVGTPNAGSAESLQQLIEGLNLNPLFPNYRPGIVGTLPAIYQLLPRSRHNPVRDAESGEAINIFDADVWDRYNWGMLDPKEDKALKWLLQDVDGKENRRAIAKEHIQKCLDRAQQFFVAMDRPASPPPGTEIYLFTGDSKETAGVLSVESDGGIQVAEHYYGDGTVTRASALMDERVGSEWVPGLRSPIAFERIQFIDSDHLGLTRDPSFVDNILYLMLESPRVDHADPLAGIEVTQ